MKNLINKLLIPGIIVVIIITLFTIYSKQKTQANGNSSKNALTTINALTKLLSEKSPYFDMNKDRVVRKIDSVITLIDSKKTHTETELFNTIEHIISELGDRHALVKTLNPPKDKKRYYLPFALAPLQKNRVIALQQLPKLKYSFYLKNYPFLTAIEGEDIVKFIYRQDVSNKYAPSSSRLSLGVEKMNEFYQINHDFNLGDSIKLTFSDKDKVKDTILYISLIDYKTKWRELNIHFPIQEKTKESYNSLQTTYDNDIAYIKIPEMFDVSNNKLFFKWLSEYMNTIKNSNGLIIDIRNNSGGKRDLINFFSNYFIKPDNYSIANYATYKPELTPIIQESLNKRSLYQLNHFDIHLQKSIEQKTPSKLKDYSNDLGYSDLYYMVLKHNDAFDNYYFYNKPVYILINEKTFSAASVFASSFKGLDNITIAGVKTDGSSGLAQSYELNGFELKFSHMLSFQKNGDLFDGIGTEPDLKITRSIDQILGHDDHQLNALLTKIPQNHN
ncbi:S41 family peptidase [Psychroserpens algicola]|uniref:S41 family peptidase n=1 Tax=Psychroserpens algicola TaxID=1719034 RepID=UPI001953132F|nr:S41 family peptidase [Psychroserpens algicola]